MGELLNIYQATKELQMGRTKFCRLVQEGKIPIAKYSYSGRHLFDSVEIKEAIQKAAEEEQNYLSYSQVASILGVSYTTAVKYCERGYFEPVEHGSVNVTYFKKEDILAFAESLGETDLDSLLTTKELAMQANVSITFVIALCSDGAIVPARKLPTGRCFYSASTVDEVKRLKTKRVHEKSKATLG